MKPGIMLKRTAQNKKMDDYPGRIKGILRNAISYYGICFAAFSFKMAVKAANCSIATELDSVSIFLEEIRFYKSLLDLERFSIKCSKTKTK